MLQSKALRTLLYLSLADKYNKELFNAMMKIT